MTVHGDVIRSPEAPDSAAGFGASTPPCSGEAPPITSDGPLRPHLRRRLVALDALAVIVGWGASFGAWKGLAALPLILLAAGFSLIMLAQQRLYLARNCTVRSQELRRLMRAVTVTAVLVASVQHQLFGTVAVTPLALGACCTFLGLGLGRAAYAAWLRDQRRAGRFSRPVLLVGAGEEAAEIERSVRDHPEMGFRITGVLGDPQEAVGLDAPWLGDINQTALAVKYSEATGVVIVASAINGDCVGALSRELLQMGVHVHLSSGLRRLGAQRIRVLPLAHESLLYVEPFKLSTWQLVAKRLMDVLLAGLAVVPALPLLALAAVAIKLDDGGPLLFRQQRVGRAGRHFTIVKLRTMCVDAEARLAELAERNERGDSPLFKCMGDPRTTRVGRFLRAASIDELPQLWNVLNGTMSLVGPRPALPTEMDQFDEELLLRAEVAPGITGLWQVEARDNPSFGPYRRLDLHYVENWSIGLDISVLLATAGVVLGRALKPLRRHLSGVSTVSLLD